MHTLKLPSGRRIRILVLDGEHSATSGVQWNGDQDEALPCEYFDLIVGSGDGGWIAIMLGRLGLTVSRTMELYLDIHSSLHHSETITCPNERAEHLKSRIKSLVATLSITNDPNEPLRGPKTNHSCRTVVLAMTAVHMAAPTLFRSYRARKFRFEECSIWEAICAATAVPGVFPSVKIGDQIYLAASHSGYCNPIETALQEAAAEFGQETPFCVINIGSGRPAHIAIPESDIATFSAAAISLANDAEEKAQQAQQHLNVQDQTYFRFNVEQGLQHYQKMQGAGYGEARSHTRMYCQRVDVDRTFEAAIRCLLDEHFGDTFADNIPSTSEERPALTLHLTSKDLIQAYINELYKLNYGLPTSKIVEIGDVGIINEDGGFEIFFNATVKANAQPYRVPPKFKPLVLKPENIVVAKDAIDNPYLTSGNMSMHANGLDEQYNPEEPTQSFRMSFDIVHGAALIPKDQVTRLALPPSPRIIVLLGTVSVAMQMGLDRDLEGHDLIFVTATYLSLDWSLGAWPKEGFRTNLTYAGLATFDEGRINKLNGKWTPALAYGIHDGPSRARPDPPESPLRSQTANLLQKQCLFVRGYKIGLRDLRRFPETEPPSVPNANVSIRKKRSWWKNLKKAARMGIPAVMKGAAGPDNLPPPPPSPPPPSTSVVTSIDTERDSNDFSLEEISGGKTPQHPLDDLIRLTFSNLPRIKTAIIHDDDYENYIRIKATNSHEPFAFKQSGSCGFVEFYDSKNNHHTGSPSSGLEVASPGVLGQPLEPDATEIERTSQLEPKSDPLYSQSTPSNTSLHPSPPSLASLVTDPSTSHKSSQLPSMPWSHPAIFSHSAASKQPPVPLPPTPTSPFSYAEIPSRRSTGSSHSPTATGSGSFVLPSPSTRTGTFTSSWGSESGTIFDSPLRRPISLTGLSSFDKSPPAPRKTHLRNLTFASPFQLPSDLPFEPQEDEEVNDVRADA
ncbi:hypothetical protein DL96DRAFT_1550962 [Flagelloscypha sp. PMI_526]|nr:hypothetical protein DL96DRAFT_1550962 [Flagelloscypha sp. PMI_526]